MTPRPVRTLVLAVCVGALACSEAGTGSAPTVSVTDSAGVRLVRFGALSALEIPERTATVAAEIGTRAGSELFRVSEGRFLESGRLALGNSGTAEVLYVDRDGEIVRRIGREGDGPGEFRSIMAFPRSRGDTLTVYDVRLGRLTVLEPQGGVLDTRPLPSPNRIVDVHPLAIGDSGRVLAVYGDARFFGPGGTQRRDTMPLMVVHPSSQVDTLGLWPAREWLFVGFRQGSFRTEIGFGRSLQADGRDGRAVVGSTDTLVLTVVDARGRERMRVVGTAPNRPVTDADVARWRADRVASLPEQIREGARQAIEDAPYHETLPAFSGLLLDADGRVWIGQATAPGAVERRWTVLAPDGAPAFRVSLPASAEPLDAVFDRLAVLDRTELDEEVVRLLTLGPLPGADL